MFRQFDSYKRHEHLSDYSDEELIQILQNIETEPFQLLACVCAEILRRQACKTE